MGDNPEGGPAAQAGNAQAQVSSPCPVDAELKARRQEAERLRSRALTDHRVLSKLQAVPDSAAADDTALALRERYVETLERRAELLESLLQQTEAQRAKLHEENLALHETVERLRYKLDRHKK